MHLKYYIVVSILVHILVCITLQLAGQTTPRAGQVTPCEGQVTPRVGQVAPGAGQATSYHV